MGQVLVTGGAGFIGSHLADALVRLGNRVTILDNFESGSKSNLVDLVDDVEIIEGDIRDEALVESLCRGKDCVFHLAAIVGVPISFDSPNHTFDINLGGTVKVLEGARKAGARFILSSSAAVYGCSHPKSQPHNNLPSSPYGLQKLLGERYAQWYSQFYGTDVAVLRYYNVYGPRQNPKSPYASVLSSFLYRGLTGKDLVIYGDGLQTRDIVYVGDIVRANLAASQLSTMPANPIDIGSGRSLSVLEIAQTTIRVLGANVNIIHGEARPGEVRFSECDPCPAQESLDFRAETRFADGLSATANWMKDMIETGVWE
ncbi:MAG: NAD-dependent epimerase/dehydratase family protein [Armatimonadetes bacterium]|nr:NAD-dependent epimerase/dehydratase family protein [Armatimonadota bacterium]